MESLMYAGMDVHKATIEISVFKARHDDPEFERQLPNAPKQIRAFFEKLRKQGPILACYEAGCMGFGLHRMLKEMNIPCQVVAPGLLPRKPGERIKNDRRDSRKLARNLRNGEVTPIYIPSEEDEAVRDYLRMFEDLKSDRKKARQRLLHFLLRHKIVYTAGKNWTVKHEQWLRSIQFENPMLKETFAEYFFHIKELDEKALRIKDKIEEIALSDPYKEKVARLRCLKGIETLTAISLVTEIGDFRRFMKAEEFMAFLGLVPSEVSSGPKRKQGRNNQSWKFTSSKTSSRSRLAL